MKNKSLKNKSIVSKTIQIKCENLPATIDFIEENIKLKGIEPVRWAISDIKDNILILNVSGYII